MPPKKRQAMTESLLPNDQKETLESQFPTLLAIADYCGLKGDHKKEWITWLANMAINIEPFFAAYVYITLAKVAVFSTGGDLGDKNLNQYVENIGLEIIAAAGLAGANLYSDCFSAIPADEVEEFLAELDKDNTARYDLDALRSKAQTELTFEESLALLKEDEPAKYNKLITFYRINWSIAMAGQFLLGGIADMVAPITLFKAMLPTEAAYVSSAALGTGIITLSLIYYHMFSSKDILKATKSLQDLDTRKLLSTLSRDGFLSSEFMIQGVIGMVNRAATFLLIYYQVLAVFGVSEEDPMAFYGMPAVFGVNLYITALTRLNGIFGNTVGNEERRELVDRARAIIGSGSSTEQWAVAARAGLSSPKDRVLDLVMAIVRGGGLTGSILSIVEELSVTNTAIAGGIGLVVFLEAWRGLSRITEEKALAKLYKKVLNGEITQDMDQNDILTNARSTMAIRPAAAALEDGDSNHAVSTTIVNMAFDIEKRAKELENNPKLRSFATVMCALARLARWFLNLLALYALSEMALSHNWIKTEPSVLTLYMLNAVMGTLAARVDYDTFRGKNISTTALALAHWEALSEIDKTDAEIAALATEIEGLIALPTGITHDAIISNDGDETVNPLTASKPAEDNGDTDVVEYDNDVDNTEVADAESKPTYELSFIRKTLSNLPKTPNNWCDDLGELGVPLVSGTASKWVDFRRIPTSELKAMQEERTAAKNLLSGIVTAARDGRVIRDDHTERLSATFSDSSAAISEEGVRMVSTKQPV